MPALLAPAIRVRPAPAIDPPYDDEVGRAATDFLALAQPPLPLDWTGPLAVAGGSRPGPVPHSGARVLPTGAPVQRAGEAEASPRATAGPLAARSLPPRRPSPAQGATMHFLSLCLEVLNGYRPATHLRPLTAPTEFAAVAEQMARARTRATSPTGPARHARPDRAHRPIRTVATRPVRNGPPARIRLRRLRVCEPRPGVAEAAAVLGMESHAFALALRLERRPSGWLCTLAQVV
jgi:hypothetical protein